MLGKHTLQRSHSSSHSETEGRTKESVFCVVYIRNSQTCQCPVVWEVRILERHSRKMKIETIPKNGWKMGILLAEFPYWQLYLSDKRAGACWSCDRWIDLLIT